MRLRVSCSASRAKRADQFCPELAPFALLFAAFSCNTIQHVNVKLDETIVRCNLMRFAASPQIGFSIFKPGFDSR